MEEIGRGKGDNLRETEKAKASAAVQHLENALDKMKGIEVNGGYKKAVIETATEAYHATEKAQLAIVEICRLRENSQK